MVRRVSILVSAALCLALLACGGGGDALGPDGHHPDPGTPQEPGNPGNPGTPDPGTPQIPDNPNPAPPVAGGYTLGLINEANPGQIVLLSNPDGSVIGLYRFVAASTLILDPLGGYTLTLTYSDEQGSYTLEDKGQWKGGNQDQDGNIHLSFKSDSWGDEFEGLAKNSKVEIRYDMDGDGAIDTLYGFVRQ
jgi:hypothetical protein